MNSSRRTSGPTAPRSLGALGSDARRSPTPWVGGSILLIGLLHLGSSLALYGPALDSIVEAGGINTLDADPQVADLRAAGFWFVCSGLAMVLLGLLVGWTERRWSAVPGFLGPALLVMAAFGIVITPASGFWLFLVPAALAFWSSVRRSRHPSQS